MLRRLVTLTAFAALTGVVASAAFAQAASSKPVGARPATAKEASAAEQIPTGKDARLTAIRKRGVINIGVAPIVPWAFRDPKGELLGFEIDIGREVASELGVDVNFVMMPFRQLIDALEAGRIDVIASGLSITPQRALVVDFSRPYSHSALELAVRKGGPAEIDVGRSATVLGMRGGGVAEEIARTNFPQATLKTFDNERQAFDALEAGTVTGVLTFSPRTNFEMARAPDKFARGTTGRLLPQTVEAFAVRKGEPSLREFLTAWIYYNEAAGWLAERQHEWFDSLDWVVRLQQ